MYESEISNYYRNFHDKVPYVPFKRSWQVRAIPPFGGALVRYIVKWGDFTLSIYLDGDESLGFYGEPYWELYPASDGDTFRCAMDDVEKLVNACAASFRAKKREQQKAAKK